MSAHSAAGGQPDSRIGLVLEGRYRITSKLGDGGMGAVYAAEHLRVKGKHVAIKVLHQNFAERKEVVARFYREAEAAASIGHPNIIEVLDMGTLPDGAAFLVLEKLEGEDFSKHIQHQGPQPIGKVVHIVSQVCDALAAAHDRQIVHRDIKPENIFLIRRGNDPCFVKVLDFGISKMHGTKEASLTQTGVALGTPYFMSPELCQAVKDIDARTDVYAIGVVMFLALTAQHPFDDETYPMLVLKICTQPPPPIQRFRPDLPPELAAIIERTLAKDRNQRFADCRELKAALAPFAHITEAPRVAPDAPRTAQLKPAALQDSGVRSSGHAATTPLPSYGDQPSPISSSHGGQMESAAWSADAPGSLPPPRAQRSLLLPAVLVLSLVAILGVVAVVLVFALPGQSRGPDVASNDPAANAPPATTQPVATAPAVAPAPTAPAQAESVHVRIAVTPPEAEIVLGDRILPNPFDGDLPRSSEPRTLLLRAPGYTSVQQQVTLSESQQIQVALQRPADTSRHGSRHHSAAPTPIVTPMAPAAPSHPRQTGPSLAGGNTLGI